jgi:UDP-glucose 4-epimerase
MRVVAVDNLSTGREANIRGLGHVDGFEFERMDVRSGDLLALLRRCRPDVVMHLAAQSGVRPSALDPDHDASVNVGGLLNVLGCSSEAGVRKIVFASSGGTIYGRPQSLPVREEHRLGSRPISPYGISKRVAEDYLRFYRDTRGLDYCALALANVYGPRQDPNGEAGVVSIFATRLLAGEPPIIYGDGSQTRDYVFVADVVEAFMAAMEHASGQLLNVGTGIETRVNEILALLRGVTGSVVEPRWAPPAPCEVQRICLDISLARRILKWAPSTPLDDGLQATVEYLRAFPVLGTRGSGNPGRPLFRNERQSVGRRGHPLYADVGADGDFGRGSE